MITKRLKAIADYVESQDLIVDVGCDHAILPIYLIKEKIISKALVSDINSKALQNAVNNIQKENLTKKINAVLSDGLQNITLENINTIIISGLGTSKITKILSDESKLENIKKLIIQSNNDYYFLRKSVTNLGYYIEDETITFDNNKYYLTILFKKGNKKYSNKDYLWGILKKENLEYYIYLNNNYKKIYSKIPSRKLITRIKLKYLIIKLTKIINIYKNKEYL